MKNILLIICLTFISSCCSNTPEVKGVIELNKYSSDEYLEKLPIGTKVAIKGKVIVLGTPSPGQDSQYRFPYRIEFNNVSVLIDGDLIRDLGRSNIERTEVVVIGTVKEMESPVGGQLMVTTSKSVTYVKYLDVFYYREIQP